MSFSLDAKNEMAHNMPEKKCCMLAEIAGFLRMNGSIELVGGGKFVVMATTDNPAIARHFKTLIKMYFDEDTVTGVKQGGLPKKGNLFTMTIGPDNRSEPILRETGILMIKEGYNFISDGVYEGLIKSKCCRKAFLKGAFLGAGTITNPAKGYHFEISTTSEILANDIKKILNTFEGILSKVIRRRKEYVVYIKDSDQIIDVLAIIGAHNKVFEYENIKIEKEIKNKANRISNCDNANIDKSIIAGQRQLEAIRKIRDTRGLGSLPDKLKDVAELRLANPEASLNEIGAMLVPPIKKPGVSKRLSKIEEISQGIKEN